MKLYARSVVKQAKKGNPTSVFFEDEEFVSVVYADYYMDYDTECCSIRFSTSTENLPHTMTENFFETGRVVFARSWGPLVMAIIVAIVASSIVTHKYMVWSNDSLRYAVVASEILNGRGLSTRIVHPYQNAHQVHPKPFTVQPPLYPLLLAAFGGINIDRTWPPRLINITMHALMTCCIYLILLRLNGVWPALTAAVLVATIWPIVGMTRFILSDTTFVGLMALCILLLVYGRNNRHYGYHLAMGVAASLSIATRYSGVFLLPLIAWEALVTTHRRGFKSGINMFMLTALPPFITVTLLWSRNWKHTSTIRGFTAPDQNRSIFDVVPTMVQKSLVLLDIPWMDKRFLIAILLVAIPTAAWVATGPQRKKMQIAIQEGFDLVLFGFLCYSALFAWAMIRYLPHYESRFFLPVITLLIPLFVVMVVRGWHSTFGGRWQWMGKTVIILSLSIMISWSMNLGRSHLAISSSLAPHRWILNYSVRNSKGFRWLKENTSKGEFVATNAPMVVAMFSEITALDLPQRWWNRKMPIPAEMETWLSATLTYHGGRYVAVFAGPRGVRQRHYGPYIAAMSRREDVGRFRKVFESRDSVIYELAPK